MELKVDFRKIEEYLKEKRKEYFKKLSTKLQEARDERLALITKVNNGESLSKKENKRNMELAVLIKEYEQKLAKFEELKLYSNIYKTLSSLNDSALSRNEKDALIIELIKKFKIIYDKSLEDLKAITGLEDAEIADLNATKAKIEDEIKKLEEELAIAQKRGFATAEIKAEIEDKRDIIEKIDMFLADNFNKATLECELRRLSLSKTKKSEKDDILNKYQTIIKEYSKPLIEELDSDRLEFEAMEAEEEKKKARKEKKKKTKEEKEKKDGFFKKHWKKIVGITTGVIGLTALLLTLKQCSKDITNSNTTPEETKESYGIESMYENADREKVDALTAKGYQEFSAVQMVKNFTPEVIETLMNVSYIPPVEYYVATQNFNIDYINDYEDARMKYSITADEAVDYVNRAYQIQATNFYEGATISQVVEIVMAIDNKVLFTTDNANLAQSFNTSFNRVVDNYLFGTTTEEDITKMDALKYFAKDGSDLDKFLEQFSAIIKSILANPTDEAPKSLVYDHINIFATSLNGFTNEPNALTDDAAFNESAQVNDYFDWYMAYNSFIAPLYPIYSTEQTFTQFEELQMLMITAMQGPEFEQLCGQSLTLEGGEE